MGLVELVKLLLKAGADRTIVDGNNQTAEDLAKEKGLYLTFESFFTFLVSVLLMYTTNASDYFCMRRPS